ncbi:MAG: hypothetical protein WKF47_06540 [Geodermatophilaceae bacterium]
MDSMAAQMPMSGWKLSRNLLALPHHNLLEQAYARTPSAARSRTTELLGSALAGLPALKTAVPAAGGLGAQLSMVAKLIAARDNLKMRRQIFFVAVQGYDTHWPSTDRAGEFADGN